MRPNKEKIIATLIAELEQGSERSEILAKYGKIWHVSKRTFDRHWKTAQERYAERQKEIQNKLAEQSMATALERQKKAILTKEQRMEIASKIAKGEAWKVQGNLIIPNGSDRLKALDYLSKIDGDYAPTKQEHTGKNGKPLFNRFKITIKKKSPVNQ